MGDFSSILSNCFHLADAALRSKLTAIATLKQVKRGTILIEVGQRQHFLYILEKGVLRGYLIAPDGREITDCFVYQYGEVITGCNELDALSLINIEALSDCDIWRIPMTTIQELLSENAEIVRIYLHRLERALIKHWELKVLMYQCDATQRYQWFLHTYPDLPNVIRGKHIASYLGMSPVTLSRLKRAGITASHP